MRLGERNKQTVWYSNYSSRTEIKDANNHATGEYEITYTKPAETAWNVNTVDSDAEVAMFGVAAIDTIVMIAPRKDFPISETSVLWYGVTPTFEGDGTTNTPYNYRVVGIRPSLNLVRFYAQKVDVAIPTSTEPDDPVVPEPPIDPPGAGGVE